MGSTKQTGLWKKFILPLIGTGGIGAIIIAFLNHGGGHNVTTGNVSGNVAVGDHATIQINNNVSPTPNQSSSNQHFSGLTPLQILKEINSARPLQRESIQKSYEGAFADWTLPLGDAFSSSGNKTCLVLDVFTDNSNDPIGQLDDVGSVLFVVSNTQIATLKLLNKGALLRVQGDIESADMHDIHIKNALVSVSQ